MAWTVEYLSSTRRQLERLDPQVAGRIVRHLRERVASMSDAYAVGHALTGAWAGFWRYRVGDYRVICHLRKERMLITVVKAGHRSDIYDQGPTAEILLVKQLILLESEEGKN